MTPPAGDPRVVALSSALERTIRRVGKLESLLRDLAGDVASLARPGAAEPGDAGEEDEAPRVRSWLLIDDPGDAREVLGDLASWLDAVYLRYAGAALPACWAWHPDVVEELLCLRQAHADAFTASGGSVQRAADWHDRIRPHAVERIAKAHGRCELALHAAGHEQARPPRTAPFTSALGDLADAWTTARTSLAPTTRQLDEADRLQHQHDARNYR